MGRVTGAWNHGLSRFHDGGTTACNLRPWFYAEGMMGRFWGAAHGVCYKRISEAIDDGIEHTMCGGGLSWNDEHYYNIICIS